MIPHYASAVRVRGCEPRDQPCRAATQENGWPLPKAWRMQVSIMAGGDDSEKKNDDNRGLNIYLTLQQSRYYPIICPDSLGPGTTMKCIIIYSDLD